MSALRHLRTNMVTSFLTFGGVIGQRCLLTKNAVRRACIFMRRAGSDQDGVQKGEARISLDEVFRFHDNLYFQISS